MIARHLRAGWGLPALLLLAACGGAGDGQPVGGVSPGEAQALNDAAAMLDERTANSAVNLPAPVMVENATAASNAAAAANAAQANTTQPQ